MSVERALTSSKQFDWHGGGKGAQASQHKPAFDQMRKAEDRKHASKVCQLSRIYGFYYWTIKCSWEQPGHWNLCGLTNICQLSRARICRIFFTFKTRLSQRLTTAGAAHRHRHHDPHNRCHSTSPYCTGTHCCRWDDRIRSFYTHIYSYFHCVSWINSTAAVPFRQVPSDLKRNGALSRQSNIEESPCVDKIIGRDVILESGGCYEFQPAFAKTVMRWMQQRSSFQLEETNHFSPSRLLWAKFRKRPIRHS